MHIAAFAAAACVAAALSLSAQEAWAHEGEVHVTGAYVTGPNEITVRYSGDARCECAGELYSGVVLQPGGARDALSVSVRGSVHSVSFGGPAAPSDASARLHVDSAEWAGGGHAHELAAATFAAADGQPPALLGLDVDLEEGIALFTFDEDVEAGRADVSKVSAGGAAFAGEAKGAGPAVSVALSEDARSALSALKELRAEAEAGAFEDASGNPSGPLSVQASVRSDSSPPEALWSESVLDLGAGTLTLAFSEYVEAASVNPGAVSVSGSAKSVPLDGAAVRTRGYSDFVEIELSPAQKASVSDTALGEARPRPLAAFPQPSPEAGWRVSVSSGVRDAAGLGLSGGQEGGSVRAVPDSTPPRALGQPVLDLSDGSVEVRFDEHIDAYNADVSAMSLVSGGKSAPLSASAASSDGYSITAYAPGWAEVAQSGSVSLELEAGAVSDLSGNALQGASLAASALADDEGPRMERAEIIAATGVLTVWFDEAVYDVSGARLSLHEAGKPSHRIRLTDSNPVEQAGPAQASVALTQAQRADVASFDGAVVLDALGGAASDASGNASARGSVEAVASGDGRRPEPVSASLDAGTGLLTVEFDEPVGAGKGAGAVYMRSGGASVPLVSEGASAAAEGEPRGSLNLRLHERQRQWAVSHGAPLFVEAGPGAAVDASGNESAARSLKIDTDARDSRAPSPESASLDLGTGTLELRFDETVGSPDPSAVTLRGGGQITPAGASELGGPAVAMQLSPEQRREAGGWESAELDAGPGAARDTSGNLSEAAYGVPVSISRDSEPPRLVSAAPSGPDRIAVEFSEDLLESSVSDFDFRVDGKTVDSVSEEGGVVTVKLSERISSSDGESLRVVLVGSVSDEDGNALRAGGTELPYVDAPNDLQFAGAESMTVSSSNALSPAHAKKGDVITVELETDSPIEWASASVNSREAGVELGERGLVARYEVGADDPDGPADVSVEVRAAGPRGGTSAFSGSDASGPVTVDNTAPEYLSASLAGRSSIYVHYTEPVASDITQYRSISVGGGDPRPPAYVSSGGSDALVEWDGAEAGPGSRVSFVIDPSVSDLAGNKIANPGEQSAEPPDSPGALALLHVPADGKAYLAHDTFVETVSAPPGSDLVVDVRDFGPPETPDPAVEGAGGGSVQFPPRAVEVRAGDIGATFPAGVQAGGFDGDYGMIFGASDRKPDASFAARHPGVDPEAAAVRQFGAASGELFFSAPVLLEMGGIIREESEVFSIDSGGATRELLGCSASVNAETAAQTLASDIRPRGSPTIDGWACVDKSAGAVWALRFSAFGATVPAASFADCGGDCAPPTMGVSPSGSRVVSGGFEYNGRATDVEQFYTPFPAVSAEVGRTNAAVLKIYDDSGPGAVAHAGLAFGLREGQSVSESAAEIAWQNLGGSQSVEIFDPSGAIDAESVEAYASEAPCSPGSPDACLRLEIIHAFAGPLEFDMVGVDLWDAAGNEWQNYFEHAVHVEGEPLHGKNGIAVNGGQLVLYPVSGVDVMSDGGGFLYKLAPDGQYRPLSNASGIYREADESWWAHEGHEDRREAAFKKEIEAQARAAEAVMERLAGGVDNPDFGKPAELQYYEETHAGRADDAELQEALLAEQRRAAEAARAAFGDT